MKILNKNTIKFFIYTVFTMVLCFNFINAKAFCVTSAQLQQISRIERNIWGFECSKDDISKRLSRIENNVFGITNPSTNYDYRINKINEAIGLESYEDSKKQAYEIDKSEISGINYPQIDKLENQMFKTTYINENIYKRLDRLEGKIFGSIQEGGLADRTERLQTYLEPEPIAKKPSEYIEQPYSPTQDVEPYMGSQKKYDNDDIYIQLSGLETALFSKTYSQDPVELRLNRLERKIFQRDFSSDDEYLRLQRLQAAANAQKTAKFYEANKIQKYTSTGLQIGSIILMILAIIL